jgi:hypothetical protein
MTDPVAQVIGAAWYWHSWQDTDYDELASSLVAGHLIECSGYVTGSNFAGFYEYPLDDLFDITFGIAEVEKDGTCVITKHDAKKGFVTEDTVKCQFLYELQGNVYLNSDVKAILDDVQVKAEPGKNRYEVSPGLFNPSPQIHADSLTQCPSLGHQRRTSTSYHQTRHLLLCRLPIRNRRQRNRLRNIREIRSLGAHDPLRSQAPQHP